MSERKAYGATPMLLRTTSDRKLGYELHLLNEVCKNNSLNKTEVVHNDPIVRQYLTREELIEQKLVKVKTIEK